MPIFDREQNKVVVRIAYDGTVKAGKSTNLRQLCNFFTTLRRSELYVPEEVDERTLYFDWLQLDGGIVCGYGLRCQMVTVPGQLVLGSRRAYLILSSDVIVFVCESTPSGISEARSRFEKLKKYICSDHSAAVSLVVQANKQDLPGALTTHEIAQELEIGSDVPIVSARANDGVGVRETAVLAIRAAANAAQKIILEQGIDSISKHIENGRELYQVMQGLELSRPGWTVDSLMEQDVLTGLIAEKATSISESAQPDSDTEDQELPPFETAVVENRVEANTAQEEVKESIDDEGSEAYAVIEIDLAAKAVAMQNEEGVATGSESSAVESLISKNDPTALDSPNSILTLPISVASENAIQTPDSGDAKESFDSNIVEEKIEASADDETPLSIGDEQSELSKETDQEMENKTAQLESAKKSSATSQQEFLSDDYSPPFPRSDVITGFIWPAATGRESVRKLPLSKAELRKDLVAQQGANDGSGTSDAIIYKAGDWCLKTSLRRRFRDQEEARNKLLQLARAKMGLGNYRLRDTTLIVQNEDLGNYWLWTVAPWVQTLRSIMSDAERRRDEKALGEALSLFAVATVDAMLLTVRTGIVLDINPSNFGLCDDKVVYLDDDITMGSQIPSIGYAILQRVDEYAGWSKAIDAYLESIEKEISSRISRKDAIRLDLERSLEQVLVRSEEAKLARSELAAIAAQCREHASV